MTTTRIAASIDGDHIEELTIGYEIIGDAGAQPWIITPGGRFSRDYPGVREFGTALAELGNRVIIWDRPNTGESDVCFLGETESGMQADYLAALLAHLDMAPAIVVGGSGGSRVSLLAGARHPDVTKALSLWWISGGTYGLMTVGMSYGSPSIPTAWTGGMEAVVELPGWSEVLEKNPENRAKMLATDPQDFIHTLERWMDSHCTCGEVTVPGLPDEDVRKVNIPALVFRSGASDSIHTRATSEKVASLLPNSELREPPFVDTVWNDSELGKRFVTWPLLAPILNDWAARL